MLKVLIVAPHGEGVGGILSQTNGLLAELRRQNLVDFRAIDSAQRYRATCDLSARARIKGGAVQAFQLAKSLVATRREFKAGVVYLRSSASFGLTRDLVLVVLSRLMGMKVCISFDFGRIPELRIRRNWEWRLLTIVSRLASTIIVLDDQSKVELASALPSKRIEQFPNGIDMTWIDSLCASVAADKRKSLVPRLVFAGMIVPAKGVVELVKACAAITDYKFELQLVGPVEPDVRASLCAIAATRDCGRWLSFTGPQNREQTVRAIADGDIFVIPSHTEAFPVTILEAMACGKPVISTTVGAVAEMLSINSSSPAGICVSPKEVPGLQAAIENLLKDPEAQRILGTAGRDKCSKQYEFGDLARRYVSLWRELSMR